MQCVGLTRGQMYLMSAIECLQFTLWAAIAASLLCILVIKGTEFFLFSIDLEDVAARRIISYGQPLKLVWIGSAIVYLCALISSFLPLSLMQKEPLIEQIRSVE